MFESWNWLNVKQITDSAIVNFVRSAANNETSNMLNKGFRFRDNNTTRMENVFKIETHDTKNWTTKNFFDIGKNLFNNLPVNIRLQNGNKKCFKSEVKTWVKTINLLEEH